MLTHPLTQVARNGRKLAAGLGALALAVTAGSTVAVAQPTAPAEWTVTSPKRQPAMLNDIASHRASTWAVGVDLVPDPEVGKARRPVVFQRVNNRWRLTPQPMRSNSTLESVAIAGPEDVWAVGEDAADPENPKPLVMRWNGSAWRIVPGPKVAAGSFGDVQIGPDGSVWAAGWARIGAAEHSVVYRYTGGTWQPLTTGLEQFINGNALAVVGKNEAWLGLNPGLAHFDGKRWTVVDSFPTNGSQIPTALAAASRNNIWLVGTQHGGGPGRETPLALHYDGVSWSRVAVPKTEGQLLRRHPAQGSTGRRR